MKHVQETKIENADRLSKRLNWKIGMESDNENQKKSITKVVIKRPETLLVEKIKKTRDKNKEVVRVVEEIKEAEVSNSRGDK